MTRPHRYTVLELDTCEFLIGSADDRLDLRDVYVYDKESGLYGSVTVEGQLPRAPTMFQMLPWTELYLGDSLTNKPERVRLTWLSVVSWICILASVTTLFLHAELDAQVVFGSHRIPRAALCTGL